MESKGRYEALKIHEQMKKEKLLETIPSLKTVQRLILKMPLHNLFKLSQDYGCFNLIVQKDLDFQVKFINAVR